MAYVTDQNAELTMQLYANPMLLQDKVLSLFENHVFGGKTVMDGNNVFTFGLEMEATMLSSIVNEMTKNFQALYPSRAQTMRDLYRHMSDYDYVGMYAYPAMTTITIMMDRDWLIRNVTQKKPGSDTFLVVLPEHSTFKIGDYTFGMHYPINIEIRKAYLKNRDIDIENSLIQCYWDTSIRNPLSTVSSNILEHRILKNDDISYLCIEVPVHQFEMTAHREDAVASTGFLQRYDFDRLFYAVRVFHWKMGAWREMPLTMSDVVYDPTIATAKIKVLSDTNQVEISIPQIYFSRDLVGSRVLVMVYTTEGELDVDLRNYTTDQFGAAFLVNSDIEDLTYSTLLKRITSVLVLPTTWRIANGSDGKTFDEVLNRIENTVGGDDLLVTQSQLAAHLYDQGFTAVKYIDNITDRIWLAKHILTDSHGLTISSANYRAIVPSVTLQKADTEYSTIRSHGDGQYTILPSSIYRYDKDRDSMVILSDSESRQIANMGTKERIDELNTGNYFVTPFHMVLSTKHDRPVSATYDLFNTRVYDIEYIRSNGKTTAHVSVYSANISHKANGTDGYILTVTTYKSSTLNGVKAKVNVPKLRTNIAAVLRTRSASGTTLYMEGRYAGVDDNGRDVYTFPITTTYEISGANAINVDSFKVVNGFTDNPVEESIPLTNSYDMLFYVRDTFVPEEDAKLVTIAESPENLTKSGLVFVSWQTMKIRLGEAISSVMDNVYVSTTGETYKTYGRTEFATYQTDTYKRYKTDQYVETSDSERDPDKSYYVKTPEGSYELYSRPVFAPGRTYYEAEHLAGDYILDEDGKLITEHRVGDLILEDTDIVATEGYLPPAMNITSENSAQTLYESISNTSALPDHLISFVPYYLTEHVEESEIHTQAVVTGSSTVETVDLLQEMLNEIDSRHAVYQKYENIRCDFVREGSDPDYKYSYRYPGQLFVYVSDATDDISVPDYEIFYDESSRTYRLEKADSGTDHSQVSEEINDRLVYGSLYMLDASVVGMDVSSILQDDLLYDFYTEADLEGSITDDMLAKYKITYSMARTLLRKRTPWIRIADSKNLQVIRDYWTGREYMSFNAAVNLNGNRGYSALMYIQRICQNRVHVLSGYETQEDAVAAADTRKIAGPDGLWDVVWCDIYDPEADQTAVFPRRSENGPAEIIHAPTPLVGDIESGFTRGALMINTGTPEQHFVIITGPSLDVCLNRVMSYCTYCGMALKLTDYRLNSASIAAATAPMDTDDLTLADGLTKSSLLENATVSNVQIAVLNKDIDFENNSTEQVFNWPWELGNWICSDGTVPEDVKTMNTMATKAKILHLRGERLLNNDGSPVPEEGESRKLVYNIDTIVVDSRYLYCTDGTETTYLPMVRDLMRNYFTVLRETRGQLIERTRLYFVPTTTFGLGDFKGNDGTVFTHNLAIEIGFRLHVPTSVGNDASMKASLREGILGIVQNHLVTGNVNCSDIAKEIKDTYSDVIQYVDLLGIDQDPDTQTLVAENSNAVSPRLKTELVIDNNGDIVLERKLTLEWQTIV